MGSDTDASSRLRAIPAVDKVLRALGEVDLPRPTIVALIRRELMAVRAAAETPSFEAVIARLRVAVDRMRAARIQPVINGTGIIIHTNLGRAPLGHDAVAALTTIAASYNNLEYDLTTGERGSRADYLEQNLAVLCGADAATVVNNCAAALILILRHFTSRKPEVIISRGELIQIGGGFRIPDILETSGAKLREVGTTNKTSLDDYADAIGSETGLILKVHRSNFFMSGFVESPSISEIAALARRKRIPLVEDLGSGAVIPRGDIAALQNEPTPRDSLKAGVQLVCFSGDKLFGGPQAGIIAGNARFIAALKRNPFFRALRCDKLILAGLQATTDQYLAGASRNHSNNSLPIVAMLQTTNEALRARAESIIAALRESPLTMQLGAGESQLGGGTSPQSTIPSVTIDLSPAKISLLEFAARLRASVPPVIGYIAGRKLKLDLRTIFPREDEQLIRVLRSACSETEAARPHNGGATSQPPG